MQDIPIGQRIRLFRLSRGMTQEQLAGLADVSPSWLSKAERGVPVDRRMGPLSRIAGVLGVSPSELMGQRCPVARVEPSGVRPGGLGDLRRALLPAAPTARVEETVDLQTLVDDAAEAWGLCWTCRLSTLGAALPGLIARGEQGRRELSGRDRVSACDALAMVYASASALSERVGEMELAVASAALATRVAAEAESPTLRAVVARRASFVLVRVGAEEQALEASMVAADEIARVPRTATADEISLHGSLLLDSAYTAARRGDASSAWRLLAGAERDASGYGLDRTHRGTAFCLANVMLYGIGIAVELGDHRAALRRAQALDPSRLPADLVQRRYRYWVDVARAHSLTRSPGDAVAALVRAERVAPEEMACDAAVRDMIGELLRRKRQRLTPQLRRLAGRLGMTPS